MSLSIIEDYDKELRRNSNMIGVDYNGGHYLLKREDLFMPERDSIDT